MKKLVSSLIFLLLALVSSAQQNGTALWAEIASEDAPFSADFTLEGMNEDGVAVVQESGKIFMQGDSFRIESESTDIWCDGASMWLLSKDIDELVITENEVLPFMKATNVRKDQKGNITATYAAEGISFKIRVTSLKHLEERFSSSFFECNPDSLDEDVIVTDLR